MTSNDATHSNMLTFPEVTTHRWSCSDTSKRFAVENPATGKTITTIQAGDESTKKSAVAASEHAFDTIWRQTSPRERSTCLLKCADALEARGDELATLLCMENVKPKQDALAFDILFLVASFRFFGGLVDKLPSEFYDRGPT